MKRNHKFLCITLSILMILSLIPIISFGATSLFSLSATVTGTGGKIQIDNEPADTSFQEDNISLDSQRFIRFIPDNGYEVDTVTVNSTPVSINNNAYIITMDSDKTVNVTFKRIAATGSTTFKVSKKDESGDPLEGAKFALVENAFYFDNYYAVSDANGIATFTDIPDGTYVLYEFLAPYGYVRTYEEYDVYIASKANVSIITVSQRNATVGTTSSTYDNGDTIAEFENDADQAVSIDLSIKKTVTGNNAPRQPFTFELLRIIGETDNGTLIFEVVKDIDNIYEGDNNFSITVPQGEISNLALREKTYNNSSWIYSNKLYLIDANFDRTTSTYTISYYDLDKPNDPAVAVAEFENVYREATTGTSDNPTTGNGSDNDDATTTGDGSDNEDATTTGNGSDNEDATTGDDGSDKNGNNPNDAGGPNTGDNSNVLMLLLLLLASAGAIVTTLICKKEQAK